ncbi:thioesterase II family protein [Streptomyces violaceorubidus]|uniref:thioesterase II family protein n=1 Tax=Streptomyces violaceorubidus TaxID=284042 RepID=UPI0004C0A5C1|nr:alpha/beta fold hydrolase [Streptomyces violaceorubidus]
MKHHPAEDPRWLRRYAPAERATRRLVCFPHAGGSATFFVPTARALTPGTDVLCVQYPGRQDRVGEPAVDDLADLADRIAATLADCTGLPLAFLGHSMGAVVAYEVARRLRQDQLVRLDRLFVSGRRAPSRQRSTDLHTLDDERFLARIGALGGTDLRLLEDPEIRAMIIPALRADYRAVETYRHAPGPLLDCPITVLIGADDPQTADEDPTEWGRHTSADVDVHVFPGGHFFLLDQAPRFHDVLVRGLSPVPGPTGRAY